MRRLSERVGYFGVGLNWPPPLHILSLAQLLQLSARQSVQLRFAERGHCEAKERLLGGCQRRSMRVTALWTGQRGRGRDIPLLTGVSKWLEGVGAGVEQLLLPRPTFECQTARTSRWEVLRFRSGSHCVPHLTAVL